jgi:hypothetical protein
MSAASSECKLEDIRPCCHPDSSCTGFLSEVSTMAEIGFAQVAVVALHMGRTALSANRSRCSRRQLTQPQLLALCARRDGDWTCRDAEVCLAERTARLTALRWWRVLDDPTIRCAASTLSPSPRPLSGVFTKSSHNTTAAMSHIAISLAACLSSHLARR